MVVGKLENWEIEEIEEIEEIRGEEDEREGSGGVFSLSEFGYAGV